MEFNLGFKGLILVLGGCELSAPRSGRFTTGKKGSAHGIGDWVALTAGLDFRRRGKSLVPNGFRTPDCPTRSLIAILIGFG